MWPQGHDSVRPLIERWSHKATLVSIPRCDHEAGNWSHAYGRLHDADGSTAGKDDLHDLVAALAAGRLPRTDGSQCAVSWVNASLSGGNSVDTVRFLVSCLRKPGFELLVGSVGTHSLVPATWCLLPDVCSLTVHRDLLLSPRLSS